MDVLEVIRQDHEAFRAQLGRLKATAETDPAAGHKMFKELHTHLTAHHETEEALLFKRLVKQKKAKDAVEEAWEEHTSIDLYLEKVKMGHKSERWPGKVSVLEELVTHHLDEEEEQVFPLVKQFLGDELTKLGEDFERQEQRRMGK